ncbi:MAG: SusC/RagA family TonB-linked outer membrane protein [Chitinophagaceae bacterium]|nr:SusC/RagA family TonB-linked outer membrane protein [Chitinophagaceae bacterium]
MKLTMLFIVACLHVSASGIAQNITLSVKNKSLQVVFKEIRRQSGYQFFYNQSVLEKTSPITMDVKNVSIEEALKACFKDQVVTYEIIGKNIVIKDKDAPSVGRPETTKAAGFVVTPIRGKVFIGSNTPAIGATVAVRKDGARGRGTSTDDNGNFSIDVTPGDVLSISFVGYVTQEIKYTGQSELNITLVPDDREIKAVVVTALGIKRAAQSVTYSTQQVDGAELSRVKNTNLINSLSGKVAGLTISSNGSGIGGSAKVILRGSKSLLGNNQALYVIDGVPVNNSTTNQPTTAYGGSIAYDGGDPISNLNPDDIDNISVLKGASAAALYGSQGANGVILVTTKSGKAGKPQINFSSSSALDNVAYKPKLQNAYGPATPSSLQSWGGAITGAGDNLGKFFQTGDNFTNSVSLSAGSSIAQSYFSYANTTARGVEPGNKLGRNNFNFREIGHFLNNKLTVDVNTNYITQRIDNTPMAGFYFNPLTGLYLFPRGVDISPYKSGFEKLNPKTVLMEQQWIGTTRNADGTQTFSDDIQQNPWWIVNRNVNALNRNRILLNASVKYEFTSWLNIQARGSIDRINDIYTQKLYATTSQYVSKSNGNYYYSNGVNTQKYGDVIANVNVPAIGKLKISGLAGTSIRDNKTEGLFYGSSGNGTGLYFPNIFTLQNTVQDPLNSSDLPQNHTQFQSVFGSVSLAYNDALYLDITGRNDWASPLTYTRKGVSFFYPSIGANAILSQLVRLPEVVTFAKVRASYAEVGNAPLAYQSNPARFTVGPGGFPIFNNTSPFTDLEPERTKSFEVGTAWRFLDDRLSLDLTYYNTHTHNQTIQIQLGQASYYDNGYLRAGNIENQGIELMLNYQVMRTEKFRWNTGINYSFNKNKVIELAPGVKQAVISGASGANYVSQVRVGGAIGDIYGTVLQRDGSGRILINSTTDVNNVVTHTPLATTSDTSYLGNPNPKWQMGWSNSFTYGNFVLSFLVDGKFGGKVLSVTQQLLDSYGVSAETGAARKAGGVAVNGIDQNNKAVTSVDPQTWYTTTGGRSGVTGEYMYDATVVRLREAALGYNIPFKSNVIRNLRVSLIGRNLFYFSKKAPFDPELTMSSGNGMAGVDIFMPPATRSFGITVNAGF